MLAMYFLLYVIGNSGVERGRLQTKRTVSETVTPRDPGVIWSVRVRSLPSAYRGPIDIKETTLGAGDEHPIRLNHVKFAAG